jgi:hypothetical protein
MQIVLNSLGRLGVATLVSVTLTVFIQAGASLAAVGV